MQCWYWNWESGSFPSPSLHHVGDLFFWLQSSSSFSKLLDILHLHPRPSGAAWRDSTPWPLHCKHYSPSKSHGETSELQACLDISHIIGMTTLGAVSWFNFYVSCSLFSSIQKKKMFLLRWVILVEEIPYNDEIALAWLDVMIFSSIPTQSQLCWR